MLFDETKILHKPVLQYETGSETDGYSLSQPIRWENGDENIHNWGRESFTFQPSCVPWWFSNASFYGSGGILVGENFHLWGGIKPPHREGFLVEIIWNHMKLRNHIEIPQSLMFMAFEFCDVGELNLLSSCKHGYIVSFRLQLALFFFMVSWFSNKTRDAQTDLNYLWPGNLGLKVDWIEWDFSCIDTTWNFMKTLGNLATSIPCLLRLDSANNPLEICETSFFRPILTAFVIFLEESFTASSWHPKLCVAQGNDLSVVCFKAYRRKEHLPQRKRVTIFSKTSCKMTDVYTVYMYT